MARKAGASSPNAGLDRNRIGERLEASVAGLQELRLLRERQEETVRRVLAGQEEEEEGDGGGSHGQRVPGGLRPARAAGSEQSLSRGPEELEAHQLHRRVPEIYLGSIGQRHAYPDPGAPNSDLALAANLSRPEAAGGPGGAPRGGSSGTPAEGAVRVCPSPARPGASPPASLAAEDPRGMAPVPGKERLFSASAGPAETTPGPQETDRGSGELKRLGSGMQLVDGPLDSPDSDSRPSSGFYDVSDSTSCSLSNSCTSVYSECPSGSRWSMQSLSQLPRASGNWSRPRSTDEATVRLMDLRAQRLPGGLGARASDGCVVSGAHRRSKVSQRPVSTAPRAAGEPAVKAEKPRACGIWNGLLKAACSAKDD
uniref:dapper homolog 2-like n=1 Tax=Pristiophorus japonicus TaxID=55135 RepID=UPI00398EAC91